MKKILIVEDYESIKNLYTEAFMLAGFKVETAQSGDEGLKKTANQNYDVIVLDMLMLELSGIDFLESFETSAHPQTIVVVVSNLDSPELVQRAKKLGVQHYLVKANYTPQELVDAIQAILKTHDDNDHD